VAQEPNEKLYEAYYMRVFSYVMTLAGNRTLAEEITQETFFRAFSRQSGFHGESDEATWLCAIAKNLFLDEKRRQRRCGPLPHDLPDSGKTMEQSAVDCDASFRIHQEAFELRIFGELSFREIGMIFGKTENWARVTYHRARLKLQERMEKEQ